MRNTTEHLEHTAYDICCATKSWFETAYSRIIGDKGWHTSKQDNLLHAHGVDWAKSIHRSLMPMRLGSALAGSSSASPSSPSSSSSSSSSATPQPHDWPMPGASGHTMQFYAHGTGGAQGARAVAHLPGWRLQGQTGAQTAACQMRWALRWSPPPPHHPPAAPLSCRPAQAARCTAASAAGAADSCSMRHIGSGTRASTAWLKHCMQTRCQSRRPSGDTDRGCCTR